VSLSRLDLVGVRAITLLNPWALAVARLGKTVENRTWALPAGRLLIHAGKADDPAGYRHLEHLGHPRATVAEQVVRSAIVAVATVDTVCHVSEAPESGGRCECPTDWATPGQVHSRLADVVALPAPVPCPGRQGVWYPPGHVLDEVAASLALTQQAPLVCTGRRVDRQGRAQGAPCGNEFPPAPGETYPAMELRARILGWKVAPVPDDGAMPHAMCRSCAAPAEAKVRQS